VRTDVKIWVIGLAVACILCGFTAAQAGGRVGAGLTYWHAFDDIDFDDFDQDGVSWFVTYQSRGNYLIGWEADFELMPEGFMGSPKKVYAPQAYLIMGGSFYGAVGIGGYYSDGDWADKPFYALRAGMEFTLLPNVYLDLCANYRFTEWGDLKDEDIDVDTDTIMLGAAVRLGF
jgi:opacity protein-like surface antigen